MQPRLFFCAFAVTTARTTSSVFLAENLCSQCPTWVLCVDHDAQTGCQSKQRTSQSYTIARPKVQIGQYQPAFQYRVLSSFFHAEFFNKGNDTIRIAGLGIKT